jgi:Tol biopolymer transport system component
MQRKERDCSSFKYKSQTKGKKIIYYPYGNILMQKTIHQRFLLLCQTVGILMKLSSIRTAIFYAIWIFMFIPISKVHSEDSTWGVIIYDTNGNIYSSNLDGSSETQLTHDGDGHYPKWSTDGQKILFIRHTSLQTVVDADGKTSEIGQPTDFYVMDRDGSNSHLIRHLEGVVNEPSWSPDGKIIGFYYQSKEEWLHQGTASFVSGFYVLPVEGDQRPQLISKYARHVDWSPDGKKLVFSVMRPANHWALHTSNVDGSDETQLLDEETYLDSDNAKWSPDGNLIAFRATVRRLTDTNEFTSQGAVLVVRPDGSHVRSLTYDLGWDCWHPWWAHKEDRLTYSCYTMPSCLVDEAAKKRPDECIARTFTLAMDDSHAKPKQIAEQKGTAALKFREMAP